MKTSRSLPLVLLVLAFSLIQVSSPAPIHAAIPPEAAVVAALASPTTRVSFMGDDGNTDYNAFNADVAYSAINNTYLVVWWGDTDTSGLVDGEFEVWGQLIDGETGVRLGNNFRISSMGPIGSTLYNAINPAVVWNSTENQYLVVWHGDNNTGGLVDGELEIWGQRLSTAGAALGTNFRISVMGPEGDETYSAINPDVAYNSTENEYLVVWQGDTNTDGFVNEEFEIWGRRLSNIGVELGSQFRISTMGGTGNPNYDALKPAVAYNSTDNQYLVVWEGDTLGIGGGSLVDGEFEIWGQRISHDGAEIGIDFRISQMGPEANDNFDALDPALAYNPTDNQYLVVWGGDTNAGGLSDEEYEIWGQLLTGTGGAIGGDFRISQMGPDASFVYSAADPAVAWQPHLSQYLVVWYGSTNTGDLVAGEFEIWGQRLTATGVKLANEIRISRMGPDGDPTYSALRPAIINDRHNGFFIVWHGDTDVDSLVENELEVWGRIVRLPFSVFLPLLRR